MALKDAIAEIVDELQEIDGIRHVPDEPPESNDAFPFAVVYPGAGRYKILAATNVLGLHNIIIELHVARKDLARDYTTVMKIIDEIPKKIYQALKDRPSNWETLGGDNEFGIETSGFQALEWANVPTRGVVFTLLDVKVKEEGALT